MNSYDQIGEAGNVLPARKMKILILIFVQGELEDLDLQCEELFGEEEFKAVNSKVRSY